jgi:hypothetical protein
LTLENSTQQIEVCLLNQYKHRQFFAAHGQPYCLFVNLSEMNWRTDFAHMRAHQGVKYVSLHFQGNLDIAMTIKQYNESSGSHTFELLFIKNNLAEDTCFLKVTGTVALRVDVSSLIVCWCPKLLFNQVALVTRKLFLQLTLQCATWTSRYKLV